MPQGTDVAYESFAACYRAAREIVLALGEYRQNFSIRSSPYLLSYATYVAATILVRTPPLTGDGGMDGDRLLRTCLEVLDEHCHLYAAARRTKSAIDALMRHFRSTEVVSSPRLTQVSTHTQPRSSSRGASGNTADTVLRQDGIHLGNEETYQLSPSAWPNFLDESEGGFFHNSDREAVMRSFAIGSVDGISATNGLGTESRMQGASEFAIGLQNFDMGPFHDLFA